MSKKTLTHINTYRPDATQPCYLTPFYTMFILLNEPNLFLDRLLRNFAVERANNLEYAEASP